MEILAVKDLSFKYPLASKAAVNGVSFSLRSGEFAVLCGPTGCGKSTLLRLLKSELSPNGEKSGKISIHGSGRVGFVTQRPDEQIVTDKVYSELAFGLENMRLKNDVIARRIAEMASYFGIEDWFERDVSTLSGGQKQLLNLAAVMVTDPDILILDEPTSQLDPIATSDFLATLKKLNRDLSLTVLIAEHRLEELIPICDRLMIMENGHIPAFDKPENVVSNIQKESPMFSSMPTAARIYHELDGVGKCPLSIREGRYFIESHYKNSARSLKSEEHTKKKDCALEFCDVFFRYEKNLPDVLRGLSFKVYENEIFCVLGGNGSGKTTALFCAAAIRKIYSGQIRVFSKKIKEYTGQSLYQNCLTLLPQDVQNVFLCNTVEEELKDAKADLDSLPFDLSPLLQKHPYDLSGGEQQLLALAKVLATKPRLLLLDEPTKGLDAQRKNDLITLIRRLKSNGMTVLIVTHDVEFAAACADRCALFFRGGIAACAEPREFFSENRFYTTAAAKITRGYFDNAVTVSDVVELCRINTAKETVNDSI